jgi:hypothetical protein
VLPSISFDYKHEFAVDIYNYLMVLMFNYVVCRDALDYVQLVR